MQDTLTKVPWSRWTSCANSGRSKAPPVSPASPTMGMTFG